MSSADRKHADRAADKKADDAPEQPTSGTRDSIVTGGEQSGGGTPAGGDSQTAFAAGADKRITGSSDETKMASRAFGGSGTGYGQRSADRGSTSGTPAGGGSSGGLDTGNSVQGGGSPGGQTSGGPTNAGGTETGMVEGGGIEGKVSEVDPDDILHPGTDQAADDTAIPDNEGGIIDPQGHTHRAGAKPQRQ